MALTERFGGLSVASVLATRATSDAGGDFLLYRDEVVSFGQVESRAEALAAALAHLGVEPGDRIALMVPPCPEFVVSMFAAAKLGAVVVPLNPHLAPGDLQYMLRHSEAVCAVTVERDQGVDYLQIFEDLMVQLPELQYLVTVGEEDLWYDDRIFQFEDLLSAGGGRDFAAPDIDPEEDCFALVYTSGTTGKPKGVELSHRNLVWVAASTADALGLEGGDRVVGISALHHVFGLGPGILSSVLGGAALVLQEDGEVGRTVELVEKHRATVHYGVPTLFVGELRALEEHPRDLSSLRLLLVSGAPVSQDLVGRLREEMCPTVLVSYSVTETASTLSISRVDDPEEKQGATVGRPLPETSLRFLETDGSELPVESVGQIGVRGPGVMLGYYRQPSETAAAFDEDGYLLTGDLGMLDEDGYVHLVGRSKEVIIRSGFNVYPREVEARLEAHPAVQEAAVVGVSDDFLGEAICACVVPVEGAIVTDQEVVDWCRETLASQKVPDLVRFLDAFPRTGIGKIRRVELSRLIQSESRPA